MVCSCSVKGRILCSTYTLLRQVDHLDSLHQQHQQNKSVPKIQNEFSQSSKNKMADSSFVKPANTFRQKLFLLFSRQKITIDKFPPVSNK